MKSHSPILALLAAMAWCTPARAQSLVDEPLEALMDVKLTTLGRRVQPEQDMAIATSVFSGDELRRAGARTVLEALSWMPGVTVTEFNARTWTVATRGDGSSLVAQNTLLLRDGRQQESPNGGLPWGTLNMPIEHIQRIEVQRGAGNTLWGTNAANCVINIVTRSSGERDTGAVEVDSSGRRVASAQWGMQSSTGWSSSLWLSALRAPGSDTFNGRDDWDSRDDRSLDATARLAVDGGSEAVFNLNAYNGTGGTNQTVGRTVQRRETRSQQREASAKLTVPQAADGRLELAGYLQDAFGATIDGGQNTRRNFDLSGNRFWRIGRHDLMAGGSLHETTMVRVGTSGGPRGGPAGETRQQSVQAYAQDEWRFGDNRGAVITGVQVQRRFDPALINNIVSGTLRLRWTATPALSLWTGLSRSGIAPDNTAETNVPSFETGLRWRASQDLQVNAALFEQRFSSLQVPASTGPTTQPPLDTRLRVHGAEGDLHWQATQRIRTDLSFTLLRARFDIADGRSSPLATEEGYFGATPRKTFKARTLYQIDDRRSVELALRARAALDVGFSPGRGVLDLALRHRLPHAVEFGVAVKQLNHDSLPDFRPPNTPFPYREVRTLAMWLAWGV